MIYEMINSLGSQIGINQEIQNDANLTSLEATADIYENTMTSNSNELDEMVAIADIYEAITALSNEVKELKESLNGGN